jgi:hypothetical protein
MPLFGHRLLSCPTAPRGIAIWVWILIVAALPACGNPAGPAPDYVPLAAKVAPSEVRAFGHELLRVEAQRDVFDASSIISIHGHAVYDLTIESPRVATFRWQGSPQENTAIEIDAGRTRYRIENALRVRQPAHPAFERMFSLGASFGQGIISQSFDLEGQVHAPSAQLARQAGAYFPLPLTKRDQIPAIEPEEFDAQCRLSSAYDDKMMHTLDHTLQGFLALQGRTQPWGIRIDPHIQVRNAAVGGEELAGIVHGALENGEPIIMLLEHLVYDPLVDWAEMTQRPRPGSQLDYVAALNPSLVMLVDTVGNDVLPALSRSRFNADRIPGDDYFRDHYRELFARIGPASWVFIADTPDITKLPDVRQRRASQIANGQTVEEVEANLEAIRQRLDEVNAILAEVAADYPLARIVPFTELVEEMYLGNMVLGGQEYSFANFGGFISLDNLHLTRVGYAVLANLFIRHMNQHLGTDMEEVDVDAVALSDPLSPAKLALHGLSPDLCPQ